MAEHYKDVGELEKEQLVPYNKLRPHISSGDLFFASGNYLVSKAIRQVTGSIWSHVGIIFNLEKIDRVLLLESVEDMGVRFAPLSKYVSAYEDDKPYDGSLVIARLNGVNNTMVDAIAEFGIDELTCPYDKDEIAKILARVVLGMGKEEHDREYICSELVYECFSRAGKQFVYDKRGFISPENIWADKDVSLLARIQ